MKKILFLNVSVLVLALVSAAQAMDPADDLARLRRERHERYLAEQAARQRQEAAVAARVVEPEAVIAPAVVPVERLACAIALCGYEAEALVVGQNAVRLPCDHTIHVACLIPWYLGQSNNTCPLCRGPFDAQVLLQVQEVQRRWNEWEGVATARREQLFFERTQAERAAAELQQQALQHALTEEENGRIVALIGQIEDLDRQIATNTPIWQDFILVRRQAEIPAAGQVQLVAPVAQPPVYEVGGAAAAAPAGGEDLEAQVAVIDQRAQARTAVINQLLDGKFRAQTVNAVAQYVRVHQWTAARAREQVGRDYFGWIDDVRILEAIRDGWIDAMTFFDYQRRQDLAGLRAVLGVE